MISLSSILGLSTHFTGACEEDSAMLATVDEISSSVRVEAFDQRVLVDE